jgi:hypothetical protein
MHLSDTIGIHVPQNIGVGIKIMLLSVLEKKVSPKIWIWWIRWRPFWKILSKYNFPLVDFGWILFGVIKHHDKEPGPKIGLLWKMSGSFPNSTGLVIPLTDVSKNHSHPCFYYYWQLPKVWCISINKCRRYPGDNILWHSDGLTDGPKTLYPHNFFAWGIISITIKQRGAALHQQCGRLHISERF